MWFHLFLHSHRLRDCPFLEFDTFIFHLIHSTMHKASFVIFLRFHCIPTDSSSSRSFLIMYILCSFLMMTTYLTEFIIIVKVFDWIFLIHYANNRCNTMLDVHTNKGNYLWNMWILRSNLAIWIFNKIRLKVIHTSMLNEF